jgi:hypothetical protein
MVRFLTQYVDLLPRLCFCNDFTTSQHTHKCNFSYVHKKYRAFPAPIFTKLFNVQYYNVQISYTDFHSHREINVENMNM